MPATYEEVLARAIAVVGPAHGERLVWFAADWMPAGRAEALASPWLDRPVDGPRVRAGIERLERLLADAEVPACPVDTSSWRAALAGTYFAGFAAPLFASAPDLAALDEDSFDAHVAPSLLHELGHLAADRALHLPPPLDECVAAWIGVTCAPETFWPGHDGATAYPGAGSPIQVGRALVRRFGARAAIRCHAGLEPLPIVPAAWREWERQLRAGDAVHLLGQFDQPWLWLRVIGPLPDDPAADLEEVALGLRAMCLLAHVVEGRHRVSRHLPAAPIVIDPDARRVRRPSVRGEEGSPPTWWLPEAVAAQWPRPAWLTLDSLDAIDDAAGAVVDGRVGEGDGFTIELS